MTCHHDPVAALVAKLQAVGCCPHETGPDSWESRCPGHDGSRRNLSIKRGDDGRALVHCHHEPGCPPETIVGALGWSMKDLFANEPGPSQSSANGKTKAERHAYPTPEEALAKPIREHGLPTEHWIYPLADRSESFRVYRFDFTRPEDGKREKSYRPVHRTPEGWRLGDPPGSLPLYHLPDLAGADLVYLTEGEKCADLVSNLGLVGTTSAHGSGSAHKSDWEPLAGKSIVILPDAGPEGERYARTVAGLLGLLKPKPTVKIVRLPVAEDGNDIEEWLRDVVPELWEPEQCRAELERLADTASVVDLGMAVAEDPGAEIGNHWPPLRLGELPPVPPFPTDSLPLSVAEFVRVVADSIGCPEDFVGLPVFIVAGAAIGRSASLLLKRGYFAPASLYGVNVGAPSSGKSPALDAVARPVWEIDEQLHDAYKAARQAYDRAMEAHDNTPKASPKPPKPIKPALQSSVVENCTVEALAPLLSLNPRGLLVARDELSAWVASFDQYKSGGRGSDRQFWLSVLFGKPIRVDRRGNPELEPIRVSCPFISVVGGIQPEMLSELRPSRGRSDGFIERILFAFPDPRPRPRWSDDGIPDEVMARWMEIVHGLRGRPMAMSPEGRAHPHVVSFDPEAKVRWIEWYDSHVEETNGPSYDAGELAVDGKLCDFAARLALILHLLHLACDPTRGDSDPIPPVSRSAVEGAIQLWAYFRLHGRRARWYMSGGIGNRDSRALLDWIKRNGIASFTERDVARNLSRFRNDPEALPAALQWLEGRHVVRQAPDHDRPAGTRGRKPSPAWDVHPDLGAAGN